jgi:hypothetical protein
MNAATLSTSIRATVFNASGGLVRNVPVIFSVAVVAGTPNGETLASGGSPVVTNASGQAQDTLTIAAASARTLRVTARTGSISSTVDIPVT